MAGLGPIAGLPSMPAVDGLRGATGTTGVGAGDAVGSTQGGSFTDALGDALNRLNSQLTTADASATAFASGQSADIGTVMLQMQEASLGLKMGIQVRDRLLDAYREVMRLQL